MAQGSSAASWHNPPPTTRIRTATTDSCGTQGGTSPSDAALTGRSLGWPVWEWPWPENGVKRNWSPS